MNLVWKKDGISIPNMLTARIKRSIKEQKVMDLRMSVREKLRELDGVAALEEVQKLFDLDVIEPVKVNFNDEAASECVVDTATATDCRFREGIWRRSIRIVAREFGANQRTDEASFSPTSAAAPIASDVHVLQFGCLQCGRQRRLPEGSTARSDVCHGSRMDLEPEVTWILRVTAMHCC